MSTLFSSNSVRSDLFLIALSDLKISAVLPIQSNYPVETYQWKKIYVYLHFSPRTVPHHSIHFVLFAAVYKKIASKEAYHS